MELVMVLVVVPASVSSVEESIRQVNTSSCFKFQLGKMKRSGEIAKNLVDPRMQLVMVWFKFQLLKSIGSEEIAKKPKILLKIRCWSRIFKRVHEKSELIIPVWRLSVCQSVTSITPLPEHLKTSDLWQLKGIDQEMCPFSWSNVPAPPAAAPTPDHW